MIDVKALRKSLGLTQIEFAELLGITQSALSLNEKRFSVFRGNEWGNGNVNLSV